MKFPATWVMQNKVLRQACSHSMESELSCQRWGKPRRSPPQWEGVCAWLTLYAYQNCSCITLQTNGYFYSTHFLLQGGYYCKSVLQKKRKCSGIFFFIFIPFISGAYICICLNQAWVVVCVNVCPLKLVINSLFY